MIKAKAAVTDRFGNVTIDMIEGYPPEQDVMLVEVKAADVCQLHIPREFAHFGA